MKDPTWMKSLEESTRCIDVGGRSLSVIEDEPLLRWASGRSLSPREAVVAAMERNVLPLRYVKNLNGLQWEEQFRICRSRVLICGCGGLGGVLASLLARAGVGSLRLVDGDAFAPSNLNRQWFCDVETVGRNKAEAARDRIVRINPFLEVEALPFHLEESNSRDVLDSMELALDALDNLPSRFTLFEAARRAAIPFIHGAVAGWLGQMATFLPGSATHLQQVYGERRHRSEAEEGLGVLGPTAALIGSLQSMEALRVLTGRPPVYTDRLLYYDGESGEQVLVPLETTG